MVYWRRGLPKPSTNTERKLRHIFRSCGDETHISRPIAPSTVVMFGRRLTLFKIFGFEVRLDPSWFFMAILIVWSLASGMFPDQYRGLPVRSYWWMGVAGALGLFASIVVHEL